MWWLTGVWTKHSTTISIFSVFSPSCMTNMCLILTVLYVCDAFWLLDVFECDKNWNKMDSEEDKQALGVKTQTGNFLLIDRFINQLNSDMVNDIPTSRASGLCCLPTKSGLAAAGWDVLIANSKIPKFRRLIDVTTSTTVSSGGLTDTSNWSIQFCLRRAFFLWCKIKKVFI